MAVGRMTRLIHSADSHIGYAQFGKTTPSGMNQRTADVETSFRRFIDRAIALAPDAVLFAGDFFHTSRPTNAAIRFAHSELSRLVKALPDAEIVIISGNHDHPRAEAVSILPLFSTLGIHVVDHESMRLAFPALELSVLCVPDAGLARPLLVPDANARYNVLLMHGEAQGVTQGNAAYRASAVTISAEEIAAPSWTYVALGDYHQYEQIAPNCYYSGSLDYVSSNPYPEIGVPKGFIERNLETGEHAFHVIEPSRAFIDLPPIAALDLTAEQLGAAIIERMESVEIHDAIVRLTVNDVLREVEREVDLRIIKRYQRACLNFNLVYSRLVPERRVMAVAAVRRMSVDERARQHIMERALPEGVDREELAARMQGYLDEASAKLAERGTDDTRILTSANPLQRSA